MRGYDCSEAPVSRNMDYGIASKGVRETPVWKHWATFWAWAALWCFLVWVALLHDGNYVNFWGSQLLWCGVFLTSAIKAPDKDWSSTDTLLYRVGIAGATWFFGSKGWIDEIVQYGLAFMALPLAFYGLVCCWLLLPRALTRPVEDFFGP